MVDSSTDENVLQRKQRYKSTEHRAQSTELLYILMSAVLVPYISPMLACLHSTHGRGS